MGGRMKQKGMERRLFSRTIMRTKVVFDDEFGEGLISLYAEDVSLGGVFLASDIPIKVGSYVFLSFHLPDNKTFIRATGQVVRVASEEVKPGLDQRKGVGIRFVGLSEESASAIQEYVSSL